MSIAYDPLQVRARIARINLNLALTISQRYLAEKLNRSEPSISLALTRQEGTTISKRPELLARIVRHLDHLEGKPLRKEK